MTLEGSEKENQKKAWRHVLKNFGKALLAINFLFVCWTLLFLGSAWSPKDQYKRVHVVVADLDGGLVGGALMAAFTKAKAQGDVPTFTYHIQNATRTTPEVLRKRIDKGDYHAGWVIPPGSSARLAAALADGSDAPLPLFELQYDEGRGGVALSNLLKTSGYNFFYRFQHELGTRLAESVERHDASVQHASPALLARPATIFEDRIHKVPYMGAANMSGFVWSVLFAMTFGIAMTIHAAYAPMIKAGVRKDQVVIAQICHLLFATLLISVWPVSVIGMLGMKYSAALFFRMWSFMWFCQFLFACCGYFLVGTLGPMLGIFCNALWYSTNLISSSATYPMEFMNPFFQIGEGLLIYQGSNGTRTILFGSYDRIHRNIGVLFGWFALLMSYMIYRWTRFHREYRAALLKPAAAGAAAHPDLEKGAKADSASDKHEAEHKPNVLDFFDPILEEPRRKLKKVVLATTFIFSIVCLIFILEFLGAAWDPTKQYKRFKIAVADYDGSLVGTSLTEAVIQDRAILPGFSYEFIDTTKVTSEALRKRVDAGDYQGAFWVPHNSTALLSRLLGGEQHDSLSSSAPLVFTFDEGRGGSLVAMTFRRAANQLTDLVNGRVAREIYESIETGRPFLGTVDVSDAPPAVVAVPVALEEDNLHPVTNPGASNLAGVVWIVLLGVGLPLGSMAIGILKPLQTELKMSLGRVKVYRVLMVLTMSISLSFWPPVFVHGMGFYMSGQTFFQCWAFLALTVFVFGTLMLVTTTVFGHAAGLVNLIILITQLISSTAVYPMEFMQPFFQIGYAFHMTQGVQAMRTILFGSYDRLGRCVGVLFGWLAVQLLLMVFLAYRETKASAATKPPSTPTDSAASSQPQSSYASERDDKGGRDHAHAPASPHSPLGHHGHPHARPRHLLERVSAAAGAVLSVIATGTVVEGVASAEASGEEEEGSTPEAEAIHAEEARLAERDPSTAVPWVETVVIE